MRSGEQFNRVTIRERSQLESQASNEHLNKRLARKGSLGPVPRLLFQ